MYNITELTSNVHCQAHTLKSLTDIANFILQNDWSHSLYSNNHRNNANFKSTQFLVFDIDKDLSIVEAQARVVDYKHIISTTRSHQIDKNGITCDRFRVVLVLSDVITDPDHYKRVWAHYFQNLFPEADKACKDPARYWYKSSSIYSINESGIDINVNVVTVAPVVVTTQSQTSTVNPQGINGLSKATLRMMNFGAEAGSRNTSLFKAAKDAQQCGLDEVWCQGNLTPKLIANDFSDFEADQVIISAFKNLPMYQKAEDPNKNMRDKILRSKIFQSINDDSTILVDESNDSRTPISGGSILSIVGKKGYGDMISSGQVINASFEYDPYEELTYKNKDGITCYNLYKDPKWRREQPPAITVLPAIYNEFFKHLTNNNQDSFDYLLDWLANMLRGRNFTYLTTIGAQGIGKGILGEIMEKLLGVPNYVKCRDTVLKNHFNGHIYSKRLVYIDELDIKKSKEAYDRIKDLANPKIEIEKKGKDAIFVDNFASIYLSSNSWDCIRLEADDRRFSIIELTDIKILTTALHDKIESEILDDVQIGQLGHYLLTHVILNDMKTPFINSQRHKDILFAGLNTWEEWVIETWAPANPGERETLKDFQGHISRTFKHSAPGRGKFEELAKKYPHILGVSKDTSTGECEIVSKVSKGGVEDKPEAPSPKSEMDNLHDLADSFVEPKDQGI